MPQPLPVPAMPVTIRPATPFDARAIAEVQVAGWHATYPGLVPQPLLDAMVVETREFTWARMLLACEEGGAPVLVSETDAITGFLSFGPQRTDRHKSHWPGEVYALYIHPEAQGQGQGTALMQAAAEGLRAMGHTAATLWVMTGNTRARAFYEGLGGTFLEEQTVPVEGGSFDEVAYGWRDLSTLISN